MSLTTCQLIQSDKVKQVEKKIKKLKEQLKSVNKDIECKHKELQNLRRLHDRSRRNKIHIDGKAESLKVNWENTENKSHKMLYDYLEITEGVVIEKGAQS